MAQAKHLSSPIRRITEQEDRALVTAVARRQPDALDHLYERYQTVVYHFALRILNNRESAEEVVHDVFWQVWREAERYDAQRGSVGAWLATLARSRAIDALRARRGHSAAEDDIAERPVATDSADNPEEIASLEQRAVLVRSALESLPADQRATLELAFFSGLTHMEIAEQLAEPLGTVKTRIRSAMLRLRERLRPLLGGHS
ncbi:MAG: sigma-70 family RNA polymerase sigma factor [Deltaproteobacteria bacterium]|nr:sigma-70 family RNA polymerase sigma factor [Deltaproteobacteria bacterium]